ncbi:response regulator [Pedobacter xixiisoli]|uniref:CheY chemotaxis protein or a CheY-like REC (Receiver) domain n=1 Tax=Pedobacter xixiisoli TaxID=1476464 RepID=A0A285ZXW0_9SPHI|nr:response regulator [Pedobacter xixiisoli]SOD14457.1 CheY chemotaxis protein or a CheY-like REC (receiver) domain [Pedobacter xixiisoli]
MPNKTGKVLLIDDNDIDLKINSKVIKLSNFFEEIIICQSGKEGIEYITKNLDTPELLPDFILLDIQMPEMDGFEFLEIYKNFPRTFLDNCKLAILSSTLDFGDIKKAEANPLVIKLLKKPLYPNELQELLNKHSTLLGI